jgi:hypothetical protein
LVFDLCLRSSQNKIPGGILGVFRSRGVRSHQE